MKGLAPFLDLFRGPPDRKLHAWIVLIVLNWAAMAAFLLMFGVALAAIKPSIELDQLLQLAVIKFEAVIAVTNKTDANDAEGLAQIVRTGWYRQVQVKSLDSHLIRTLLAARAGLVTMHRDVANQIRGTLKTFGLVLGKVAAGTFEARVRQLIAGNPLLVEVIEALLKVWRSTGEQLVTLHRRVLWLAQTDETCRRLMTVPGVGAVTAAAFLATVDDPERFRRSSSVGAYFGLTPRRCQSGDIDYTGRISKRGDGLMRTYLFEAANVLLTRVSTWSTLKAWGMRLAKRSGATKAKVALARKLAVILHRLWCDGTSFRWSTQKVSG